MNDAFDLEEAIDLEDAIDLNATERGTEPLKLSLGPACPACDAWLGRPSVRIGRCVCLACGAEWMASRDELARAEGAETFDVLRAGRRARLPHESHSRSGGYRGRQS